jgi:hypothetical protein
VTRPQKPRTTLQRRAISAVTTRLPLKFAAIGLAVILWAIVGIEEPTESLIDVVLQPVPTDSSIVVRRPLERVQAYMVGRARDLFRLASQPPVIRIPITAEAPETLTVRLSPEMVDLPVDVSARVRDVAPRSVTLRLDILAEKRVPVASVFAVEHDTGLVIAGPIDIEPDSVTIAGPRALVESLDSVYTRRVIVQVTDTLPRLVALDTARLGVVVRPSRVAVRVPLVPSSVRPDSLGDSLPDTLPR